MAPFLARLPRLSLAERALAVHFGHFPGSGQPPRRPRRSCLAARDPATDAGAPDAGQPALGGRHRSAPEPVSTAPRRRPGAGSRTAAALGRTSHRSPRPVRRGQHGFAGAGPAQPPTPVGQSTSAPDRIVRRACRRRGTAPADLWPAAMPRPPTPARGAPRPQPAPRESDRLAEVAAGDSPTLSDDQAATERRRTASRRRPRRDARADAGNRRSRRRARGGYAGEEGRAPAAA